MARRFSRRRSVRGRPNYCWITTCGSGTLASVGVLGPSTIYDQILIPTDWQTVNATNNECTLVHTVYTHCMFGTAVGSNFSFCGLYAIVKTGDQAPGTSPPNLGKLTSFVPFFDEYDECLHWGQYTAMPYDAAALASGLWVGGGSVTALPENMVNLNSRRKLKGDEAINVIWSAPDVLQDQWVVRWFARSLVRIGLK